MIRLALILLALSVPAWAGDPAQYNLVQSPQVACFNGHPCHAVMVDDAPIGSPPVKNEIRAFAGPELQAQLDRIEQMLRVICEQDHLTTACAKEPKR